MEKFNNFNKKESGKEQNSESKENHEFTIEDIKNLLKRIDGKEHPDLVIKEKIENIKGETTSIVFTDNEKEMIENKEHEITYLLTLPGQRYKPNGTEGRLITETVLTKDYDDGMFFSEKIAYYSDGKWTNIDNEQKL
jgi:hypothetical protein